MANTQAQVAPTTAQDAPTTAEDAPKMTEDAPTTAKTVIQTTITNLLRFRTASISLAASQRVGDTQSEKDGVSELKVDSGRLNRPH